MKVCTQCTCSSNLRVDLGLFARDEKLPFVEHILGLLIKDRFGAYRRVENLPLVGQARDVLPTNLTPPNQRPTSNDPTLKRLKQRLKQRLECKHPCLPAVENRSRSAAFNSS